MRKTADKTEIRVIRDYFHPSWYRLFSPTRLMFEPAGEYSENGRGAQGLTEPPARLILVRL